VQAYEISANGNGQDVGKLAASVVRAAERHGRNMPGETCFYELRGFRAGGDTDQGQHLIVVKAAGKSTGVAEEQGSANLTQALAQVTRMLTDLHKLLITSQEGRAEQADRMIRTLGDQLARHEQSRMAVVLKSEELLNMNVERERERHEMQLESKRLEMMGDKLESLLPVFINRVMGGGPGKGTPYTGEEIVMQLLGSLKPEQIDGFMSAAGFSPEQQALFGELYMSYASKFEEKRKRKLNARGDAAANGTTNGTTHPKE
jgi:hypothetical protein